MKLNKRQIQVLTVVHLIAAVMLMGVIFLPLNPGSAATDTPPVTDQDPPYVHNKYRTARPAFNENLNWEINIGGSGNDIVERTYQFGDNLHIIGTTNSSDYDFDDAKDVTAFEQNTFMVTLSKEGKLIKYNFYEGTLNRSVLFNDGIVLFLDYDKEKRVMLISPDGDVVLSKTLALTAEEKIVDIVFNFDFTQINLIISINQTIPPQKKLKILTLTNNFEPLDGVVLTHSYDLEYIAAYPHGNGYIVAANASSNNFAAMLIYEWKNNPQTNLAVYDCTIAGRKYHAVEFYPYDGGYAALILDSNNIPDILTINDTTLRNSGLKFLNEGETRDLGFYSDGRHYYVYLFFESGVSIFYRFKADLTNMTSYTAFNFHVEMNSFRSTTTGKNTGNAYFGGRHSDTAILSIITDKNVLFQTSFGAKSEKIINIIPFDGYIIAICESRAKSFDVGGNFGASDIWVVKIKGL